MLNGGTLNWFAVPIANVSNPLPLFAVVAINVALMGAVENFRRTGGWVGVAACSAASLPLSVVCDQPGYAAAWGRIWGQPHVVPRRRRADHSCPSPPPAAEGPAGYSPGVGKFDESAYDNMDPLYPGGCCCCCCAIFCMCVRAGMRACACGRVPPADAAAAAS